MNCFEIVKRVLDEAYHLIPGEPPERDEAIKQELGTLSKKYAGLVKYAEIDYSQPATRFAYVFRYVTSHANLVASRIGRSEVLKQALRGEGVKLACLGGGPGSDLVGVLKHLESVKSEALVSCQIFDKETAWGETWVSILQGIEEPIRLRPTFNQMDVTEPASYKKFANYLGSDVFTMIYFLSEVYGLRETATPYFEHVFRSAKAGALFLFVDNNATCFTEWFDALANANGLERVEGDAANCCLPWEEEKANLGEYYTKFGNPKITANVVWRVGRKL